MGRRLVLALAALVCGPASATEVADCIAVEPDLDRLACYDRAAGRTPAATTVQTKPSEWLVTRETSAMTDQTDVTLSVSSAEPVDCGWNRSEHVQLVIRCKENTTALYFATGCHMTSSEFNDYGDVTWRVDDRRAATIGMRESTDNRALGLWSGDRAIPAIKQLLDGNSLLARMTPFGENPFTAAFPIGGLSGAIAPLRQSCGW